MLLACLLYSGEMYNVDWNLPLFPALFPALLLQKRAQTIASREFHKKNIKEKAAHLASMFGYMEFPKVNIRFCTCRTAELEDIFENPWGKTIAMFCFFLIFLSFWVDLKSNLYSTENC